MALVRAQAPALAPCIVVSLYRFLVVARLKLSDWEISVLGFKHVGKSTVGGPDANRSFANMRVCALPQNMFAKTFTKCMSSSMICVSCMRFTIVFL